MEAKPFLRHLRTLRIEEIATSALPYEVADVRMIGENSGRLYYVSGLCVLKESLPPFLVYTEEITESGRGFTRLVPTEDISDYRIVKRL